MDQDFQKLLAAAKELAHKQVLTDYCISGQVACALMTKTGQVYTGISLTAKCALGNCAEYAAIMEMLKHNESQIDKIVAYSYHDTIYSMRGRCRELIRQIDEKNIETQILVNDDGRICRLRELLPEIFVRKGKTR